MATPMSLTACTGCGIAVASTNVLYTTDARPVCAKCYANADIVETDKRHAHNIRNTAVGAAIGGVFSFFSPLSGFGIVVIAVIVATMISAIYALRSMTGGQERFTKHLTSGDRMTIWICSIFGMTISGLVAVLWLTGTAILMTR